MLNIFYVFIGHLYLLKKNFFLVELGGFELRALSLQSRCSTAIPPVHFALVILEMGSLELFALTGLETLSS
jgi:hypothetical protein